MIKRRALLFLAGAAAAVVLAAGLNAAAGQVPPDPPSRFVGTVTIDGGPAPEGAAVIAVVDGETCATSSVFRVGGQSRYAIDVPAGCGALGDTVTFTVSGRPAGESGPWANYQLGLVNLTVTRLEPTGGEPTPRPPDTGDSEGRETDGPVWPYAVLGVLALAAGVCGASVYRRNR